MNNMINVVGRLTADPTLSSAGSSQVCNLRFAGNSKVKGEDKTIFYSTGIFGQMAEVCARSLKKGSRIFISGELIIREYTNKSGGTSTQFEIIYPQLQFLDGAQGNSEPHASQPVAQRPARQQPVKSQPVDNPDDLPF